MALCRNGVPLLISLLSVVLHSSDQKLSSSLRIKDWLSEQSVDSTVLFLQKTIAQLSVVLCRAETSPSLCSSQQYFRGLVDGCKLTWLTQGGGTTLECLSEGLLACISQTLCVPSSSTVVVVPASELTLLTLMELSDNLTTKYNTGELKKPCLSPYEVYQDMGRFPWETLSRLEYQLASHAILTVLLSGACVSALEGSSAAIRSAIKDLVGGGSVTLHRLSLIQSTKIPTLSPQDQEQVWLGLVPQDGVRLLLKQGCISGGAATSLRRLYNMTLLPRTAYLGSCPELDHLAEDTTADHHHHGVSEASLASNLSQQTQFFKGIDWVAALIACTLVNISSLLGLPLILIKSKPLFQDILLFMISLAIGTFIGDAFMHLIPHAIGIHRHNSNSSVSETVHQHVDAATVQWKFLAILAGIYLFYILEILLHGFTKHSHSHGMDTPGHAVKMLSGGGNIHAQEHDQDRAVCECQHGVPHEGAISLQDLPLTDHGVSQEHPFLALNPPSKGAPTNDKVLSVEPKNCIGGLRTIVWMVMIGDGIHNCLDGMAIGTAFAQQWPAGFAVGVSTSLAILFHELPHELGDFAILLSSGVKFRVAFMLNLVSSLFAYLGVVIGTAVGQNAQVSEWILAVTSGMFIYIALVDMLPELLHNKEVTRRPRPTLILQNLGILLGITLMLVLASYEGQLVRMLT